MLRLLLIAVFLLNVSQLMGQGVPDTSFSFQIESPKYEYEKGATICIDSAHNNLHTKEGSFSPFAKILSDDGYKIHDLKPTFAESSDYENCKILVVSNAIHAENLGNWVRPIHSAFEEEEIILVSNWVKKGGRLFLIADHMPFAGAASKLANVFGFGYSDGFARLSNEPEQWDIFSEENGRLKQHQITKGINSITSFTGSAFTYPDEADLVMTFNEEDYSLEPDTAWRFNDNTPRKDLKDYSQGALLEFGEGRIAVFGEAAMFTARTVTNQQGEFKVGFNSPLAPDNAQFLLNLIHWLDE